MANPASDDLVAEIRAGLEGVTPGPWTRHEPETSPISTWVLDEMGYQVAMVQHVRRTAGSAHRDAEHIARCHPDNIRALLARLEAEMARADKAVQFAEQAKRERDLAREYGKEVRIRENQAENSRIHEQRLRHAAEADRDRLADVVAEARMDDQPMPCDARIGATFFAKGVKASTVIMSIRGQVAFAAKEAARAWQKHGEAG